MHSIYKITSILALCLAPLMSLDSKNFLKTLEAYGLKAQIVESSDLGNGLSAVIISLVEKGESKEVPLLATNDGSVIFQPEELFIQNKSAKSKIEAFYKAAYDKERAKTNIKVQALFKAQSANVFHFKAKNNANKTIYIISDPNCPHCQSEFKKLSERLESANVELLVVGFLGEDSMLKAANAIKAKSNNQAKDIAMLSALYSPNSKGKPSDTKAIIALSKAAVAAGVRSVPYVFEDE